MLDVIKKLEGCAAICRCSVCGEDYHVKYVRGAERSPVGDQCQSCKTVISSMVDITREKLLEVFDYDPSTGKLTHKRTTISGKKNELATFAHSRDYLSVCIGRKQYLAHRIIYLMVTGKEPNHIDHINHNKSDNRWDNLRNVMQEENNRNMPLQQNSSTKITGVSKFRNKFRAYIGVAGKHKHLGVFDSVTQAIEARKTAEVLYGYHSNHGI